MTDPTRDTGPPGKQGSLLEAEVIEDFFFSVRNHDSMSITDDLGVDSHCFEMFLGPRDTLGAQRRELLCLVFEKSWSEREV